MKKRAFQLSPTHRRWLYLVSALLFLSGALWWLADFAVQRQWPGESFGRGSKPWLLKTHGGAAMAFLIVLGTLWPNHIRRAWQAGQNRISGSGLLTTLAVLILTGYGLYYLGDERWRDGAAMLHDSVGWLVGGVLAVHIYFGRHSARRRLPRLPATESGRNH